MSKQYIDVVFGNVKLYVPNPNCWNSNINLIFFLRPDTL